MTGTNENQTIIILTEKAAQHIRSILAQDGENAGKSLRVFVECGGCSGKQYGMVFDERHDDDLAIESQGVPVLIDSHSADLLRGAVINFVESLTASGFKISNPNARNSCCCGKSFEA